jgi:hypothetical protein
VEIPPYHGRQEWNAKARCEAQNESQVNYHGLGGFSNRHFDSRGVDDLAKLSLPERITSGYLKQRHDVCAGVFVPFSWFWQTSY